MDGSAALPVERPSQSCGMPGSERIEMDDRRPAHPSGRRSSAGDDAARPLGTRVFTLKFVLTKLDPLAGARVAVTGLLLSPRRHGRYKCDQRNPRSPMPVAHALMRAASRLISTPATSTPELRSAFRRMLIHHDSKEPANSVRVHHSDHVHSPALGPELHDLRAK